MRCRHIDIVAAPWWRLTHFCCRLRLAVVLYVLASAIASTASAAEAPVPVETPAAGIGAGVELVYELDAYYSNVGLFVPLTSTPIPDVNAEDEIEVYRHLLRTSWPPRFFLLEASVDPLPVAGVYLKANHSNLYSNADLNGGNLIESITAGFQEPYALTLFFGNVATFIRKGEPRRGTNKGYMGYMFSVGNQHIKHNELINDKWLEIEWKLKGDREFEQVVHRWSFRLGLSLHQNRGISDAVYFGLRRSNLDYNASFFSWRKNSNINFKSDFSLDNGQFLRQELTVGKKYPFKSRELAATLDVGFIWESAQRYRFPYRTSDQDSFTLVFRPNIEF